MKLKIMLTRLLEQLKNNKAKVFNYLVQIVILLVVLKFFIAMIKPVVVIAQYSHPTLDDYWMSMAVYRKWTQTHSIWAFITEAFKYAIGIYKTWDGNFLSMFLTSMSPIVFGESAYPFTFYFMFVTFMIGAMMAAYGLLYRRWHMPIINSISIMLLFTIFFMNYLYDAGEGLYWWPGVANYTFFFGLFMFAHGLYAIYWEKEKTALLVVTSICMFLLGLGNPFTSLVSTCLTVYELAYHIYVKRSAKTLRWIPFVCALAGLIIIVVAPGNKARVQFGTLSVFETIKRSFYEGTIMINSLTQKAMYFYYAMVAVIAFWSFYCSEKTDRSRFKLPPVVCILMVCLVYASFAPTKYTISFYFGRVLDTNFFISMMSFTVSIIYLCGALVSWLKSRQNRAVMNIAFALAAMCAVVLCRRELKDADYYNLSTAFRANGAMEFGTVYEYDRILNERYDELVNSPYWDVYITEPPYVPVFVHDDKTSYTGIADYYGKNVILSE